MRIIHSADYRHQVWKDGGGTTTEIAIAPAGGGLDAFDWRLSMALVERSGPFSLFPGIDRTLLILEGSGLALHMPDRGIVRLERATPPYSFPGDIRVEATLAAGPVLDLNLMSRRGRWRHSLYHVAAISAFRLVRHGAKTMALMRGATGTAEDGRQIDDGDTLLLEEGAANDAETLRIYGAADLYIADLWPAA
jgi:environmental stress-induced protein Ves